MALRSTRQLLLGVGLGILQAASPVASYAAERAERCPGAFTVPAPSDFAKGTLANGLQYVIERRSGYPPSILLAVNAGGSDHPAEQAEVAHIIEHIGLASYAEQNDQLGRMVRDQQIETVNGGTGPKNTTYFINVLPGTTATPEVLLGIVRYWLKDIPISENFARERGVVLSETSRTQTSALKVSNRRSVYFFGSKSQIPFMYLDNKPGYRNITELVPQSKVEDAEAFYRKWYRPDLATVVIVGDVDVAEWRAALESTAGKLDNPPEPSPRSGGKRVPNAHILYRGLHLPNRINVESAGSDEVSLRIASRSTSRQTYPDGCAEQRAQLIAALADSSFEKLGAAFRARASSDAAVSDLSLSFGKSMEDVALDAPHAGVSIPPGGLSAGATYERARASARAAVIALRTVARFGVDEDTLSSVKRARKSNLFGKLSQGDLTVSYQSMIYANGGSLLYRPPSRSGMIDLIDGVTIDEVNAYLRQKINFRDLGTALVAPQAMLDDPDFQAAIERGLAEGKAAPIEPLKFVAREPVVWPAIARPPLSTDIFVREGDMAKAILPGGQTLIIRKVANPAGFSKVALSFGSAVNFDGLLNADGDRYLNVQARAKVVPKDVSASAYEEFTEDNWISVNLEVRRGVALAHVQASPMDPEALFRSGGAFVKALGGSGELKLESITAMRADAGPLARAGWVAAGFDTLPEDKVRRAFLGFKPQYIIISGDFDLDRMISLASRYLAELPPAAPGNISRDSSSVSAARQMLSEDARKTASTRAFVYSIMVSPDQAPAMEVVYELAYLKLKGEARSLGSYEFDGGLKYWPPNLTSANRVLDVYFNVPSNEVEGEQFDAAVERVSRDLATGQFDDALFRQAVRRALVRRYEGVELVELNDFLIGDLISGRPVAEEYQNLSAPILNLDQETVRKAAARFFSEASVNH
ncbi:M16 family metallopeptidase [Sphingopyxis fribergensis]